MGAFQRIALALVIIGAINWGLIGFFQFDLVASIFGGQGSFLARLIYGLVGLSGLVCLGLLFSPKEQQSSQTQSSQSERRNMQYATEFGEEENLSKLKKD